MMSCFLSSLIKLLRRLILIFLFIVIISTTQKCIRKTLKKPTDSNKILFVSYYTYLKCWLPLVRQFEFIATLIAKPSIKINFAINNKEYISYTKISLYELCTNTVLHFHFHKTRKRK